MQKARKILATYNELLASLESHIEPASHRPHDELEVFSIPLICETFLPVTLNFLQKKYPYIKVKIQEINVREMFNRLETSPKSIGLLLLPRFEVELLMRFQKSDLILEEINKYKLMACVSKSSPLAKKSAISFDEFIKHPLSIYSLQTRILDHLYKGQVTPNIILNSTNIHLCRETIAKGLAIGFTEGLVEKYLGNKNAVPVPFEEDIDIIFYVMTTAEMLKKNSAKELLKALKSKAAI